MYTHVPAHEDNVEDFSYLSCSSQLNYLMDQNAKQCIWDWEALSNHCSNKKLPLEAIMIYVGNNEVPSNSSVPVRFWVNKAMAPSFLQDRLSWLGICQWRT